MGCFGNLLKTFVPNGLFWKPSENTSSHWVVLATFCKHWYPMGCSGNLLKTLGPAGLFWNPSETLVPNGLFWKPPENIGSQWVVLETF
jgi:hypothetical protein